MKITDMGRCKTPQEKCDKQECGNEETRKISLFLTQMMTA